MPAINDRLVATANDIVITIKDDNHARRIWHLVCDAQLQDLGDHWAFGDGDPGVLDELKSVIGQPMTVIELRALVEDFDPWDVPSKCRRHFMGNLLVDELCAD